VQIAALTDALATERQQRRELQAQVTQMAAMQARLEEVLGASPSI
jgi:hypothetical protein